MHLEWPSLIIITWSLWSFLCCISQERINQDQHEAGFTTRLGPASLRHGAQQGFLVIQMPCFMQMFDDFQHGFPKMVDAPRMKSCTFELVIVEMDSILVIQNIHTFKGGNIANCAQNRYHKVEIYEFAFRRYLFKQWGSFKKFYISPWDPVCSSCVSTLTRAGKLRTSQGDRISCKVRYSGEMCHTALFRRIALNPQVSLHVYLYFQIYSMI